MARHREKDEIETLDGEIWVIDFSTNTKEMREKYHSNTNLCYISYTCKYCGMWFERSSSGGRGSYSHRDNSIITTPNGYHLDKETGKIIETKTVGQQKIKGPCQFVGRVFSY
jgi:hypothetical protein